MSLPFIQLATDVVESPVVIGPLVLKSSDTMFDISNQSTQFPFGAIRTMFVDNAGVGNVDISIGAVFPDQKVATDFSLTFQSYHISAGQQGYFDVATSSSPLRILFSSGTLEQVQVFLTNVTIPSGVWSS